MVRRATMTAIRFMGPRRQYRHRAGGFSWRRLLNLAHREHGLRGQPAAGSSHESARVRPGPAEKQPLDRAAVSGRTQHRPHREQLIERQLAMEDVPPGKPVLALQLVGGNYLGG